MRDTAPFFDWNLRCRDLDTLINLHRVTIDDFAAKTQRQFDSQRALAGGGRSNDSDDAGSAGVPPAIFLYLKVFVGITHPREMISRIAMTSQMMASSRIAPMIWFRERRIDLFNL